MINKLKNHQELVLKKLQSDLSGEDIRNLQLFNTEKIHQFQHERLIHLIVTMTIGIALVIFIAFLLAFQLYVLGIPILLLFILFVPYIFHYYHLENDTQKLYDLCDRINEKIIP
jgi:hypothetical protein